MRPALRFAIVLVLGVGLVATAAAFIFNRIARNWFEGDERLRAELAVKGGRRAFIENWRASQKPELEALLVELTADERIRAAEACSVDLVPLARTPGYPAEFGCQSVGRRVGETRGHAWSSWASSVPLAHGDAYVTAVPVIDRGTELGFVTLVHDLRFIAKRQARAREFLFIMFGFLALAGSVVTMAAARFAVQNWKNQFRRLLR